MTVDNQFERNAKFSKYNIYAVETLLRKRRRSKILMNILTKLIRQNKSRFRLEDDIQDADINELIAETLSERFCPHEISISGEGADEEIHLNSCPGSEENGECKQCQL